jgi:hypothetical protein
MSDTTDRHPLDALAEIDCPHTRHHAMCAVCAADAVRDVTTALSQRAEQAERDAAHLRDAILTIAHRIEHLPNDMFGRAILTNLAREIRTLATNETGELRAAPTETDG